MMKQLVKRIPVLVCCSLFFFIIHTNVFAFKKPKTFALVIGITTYQDSIYNNLQYPASDALRFADFLRDPGGRNVSESNIRVLLNEQATLGAIIRGMDWLKSVCKKGDTAFIFFSGHGALETLAFDNQGYLLAYNTPRYHYRGLAVPITGINGLANSLSTKNKAQVILVTDACHSGKLAGNFLEKMPLVAEALNTVLNNEVRLAACQPFELAKEGSSWGGGVFTYYLLNGLRGDADNNSDGLVRYDELAGYLQHEVQNDKELSLRNEKQSPAVDGPPNFLMARKPPAPQPGSIPVVTLLTSPDDLMAIFETAKPSPLSYFFSMSKYFPFEGIVDMEKIKATSANDWGQTMLQQYIPYYDSTNSFDYYITFHKTVVDGKAVEFFDTSYYNDELLTIDRDSLLLLQQQLKTDKKTQLLFVEKWTDWLHQRGVSIIDAYLNGDISELEKRQYYSVGSRTYQQLIDMQLLLLKQITPKHSLYNSLLFQNYYLSGLVCRLKMAFSTQSDTLLQQAFSWQYKASALDNKTGYINNELGNLHLFQGNLDSAAYYFKLAAELAPAWAVPWSNLIRYNVAKNDLPQAYQAAHVADSLQPHLSFVFTNLGLAYEKEKRWLDATDAYYEAIAFNDVHFLPYQRLGEIWLAFGDYAKADKLFYEAELRRDQFAVNEDYFQIGVELGGYPRAPGIAMTRTAEICEDLFSGKSKLALRYFDSAFAYSDMVLSERIRYYEQAAKIDSALPYVHHLLGRLYLEQGEYTKAATAFTRAVRHYKTEDEALYYITNKYFPEDIQKQKSNCLYTYYQTLPYEANEDKFLLAHAYEKANLSDKAIGVYAQLIAEEKNRDSLQASLDLLQPLPESFEGQTWLSHHSPLLDAMFEVSPQVAYLKLMALYEQLGQYRNAEKVLLDQVAFQQKCGWMRDTMIFKLKTLGMRGSGLFIFNYYWLLANRHPEAAAYDFYRRMINQFARDPYWYQQGGLLLYKRMELAYERLEPEMFADFTAKLDHYAFPWQTGEGGPDENDLAFIQVPGLNEELRIPFPVYNPLFTAHNWLDSSWRLYKNNNPSLAISVAMADLNAWQGNYREAYSWYNRVLQLDSTDVSVRIRYAELLSYHQQNKQALEQQITLYKLGALPEQQFPAAISSLQLNGQWDLAGKYINNYSVADSVAQWQKLWWKANLIMLSGDILKAIQTLANDLNDKMDSTVFMRAMEMDTDAYNWAAHCYYALARWHMLLGNQSASQQYADTAVTIGFNAAYVLHYDKVWANIKDTSSWQSILEKCRPISYNEWTDEEGRNVKTFIGLHQITIPSHFDTEENWQY